MKLNPKTLELPLPIPRTGIAEGETATIWIQPQRSMTVHRIIVNSHCAPFFTIEGIHVQRRDRVQSILNQECSAMVFSECAIGTRTRFDVEPGDRIALFVHRPRVALPWGKRFRIRFAKRLPRWLRRWFPEPARVPLFSGMLLCHVQAFE